MELRLQPVVRIFFILITALVTLAAIFGVLVATPAHAAQSIPYKINFQGRLTDNSGNILTDGSYNIKFRIFNAGTGGTNQWEEDRVYGASDNRIQVVNGLFNIQFGDLTALSPSLFSGAFPLYLEVELPTPASANCASNGCAVFTEGAMTPRQALASSPYAFNSDTLDGFDSTAFSQLTGTNTFTGANLFAPTTSSTVALTVKATTAGSTNSLEVFDSSGARQAYFDASGRLNVAQTIQATSNNTVDIGASGTTFRTGYFGTSVSSPSFTGSGAVTLSSGGAGDLNLDSASNTITIAANDTTLKRTAAGTYTVDLNSSSATTLAVTNSAAGVASLTVEGNITVGAFAAATSMPVCSSSGVLATCNSNPSGVSLQQAYAAGNSISTTGNDIAYTLNTSQNFTVATAAGATGATTFSLTDGSNATPPAQLVLVRNNDINQPLAVGVKVTSAGGGVTTAFDASGTGITNALAIGGNAISGTNFGVTSGGAVTAVGVNAGTGILQGIGGLTTSGAASSINNNSNFTTGINTGNSTGAVSIGNSLAGAITLQSAAAINTTAGAASTISTGANTLTLTSTNLNANSSGDITTAFTQLDGTSTTNGTGAASTSLTLISTTNFDVGNYVQVQNSAACTTGGPNTCYAKITAKVGNVLTITPGLTWATGRTVNEFHIPEIGGTDTAQTLTNRYGRGYFISGVATGNGTTYYNEDSIDSSLATFNLLTNNVTGLTVGSSGTTTTLPGSLVVSGSITGAGPGSGASGHLTRSGTTLSPTVSGDNFTTTGNISTTGSGAVSSAGAITAPTSTNTINGLVINAGALSGISTISTSGAINTATITGGSLSGGAVSGGTLTASSVNGLSVSGGTITTPTISGAISAATTTNTINGLIINGGALSGITGITLSSGNINAGTGTITGNGSGLTNLNPTNLVQGSGVVNLQSAAATALNLTGAAPSTWDIGNNILSLQTTNNGAITTGTGLLTQGGNVTFSGTANRTITGPGTGGLTITVPTGPLTVQTTTSGTLAVTSAGALNLTGAAASSIDAGANTLSLQTTNNGAITTGTGLLTVGGDLAGGNRIYLPSTTGTNGQGYFIRNPSSAKLSSYQALDLSGNTYAFFGTNKYFDGAAWQDDGLGRVGSSFQVQNDNFTFYSFDTATNFTPRLTVASGGNVGIGTTGAPSALFSVGTTSQFQVDGSGNLATTGDGAFNGGDITTTSATATLFNATATNLNLGGAATTLTVGATTGTTTIRNNLAVGSGSTSDANQLLLNLDSYSAGSGSTADTATCSGATNQGALYYNTTTNAVRSCVNGAWEDLVTTGGLGVLAFGVVPDSGSNPGDVATLTTAATATGPCQPYRNSATSIGWTNCIAYSSGRKIIVAAGSITTTNAVANQFQHLCLTTANTSQPALSTAAAETANLPAFSANNPILCLADVKFGAANNTITEIYDTRVFSNSVKEFAYTAAAMAPGRLATVSGGKITNTSTTAGSGNVVGIVGVTDGTTVGTNGAPNAILITGGHALAKATAGTAGQLVQNGGTAGYANTIANPGTGGLSRASYALIGFAQNTFSATCTTQINCFGSLLVNIAFNN